MQQEPTPIDLRLAMIEARIAELERFRQSLDGRDVALLARVDGFIDDLRRLERNQMISFDALRSEIANLTNTVNTLTGNVNNLTNTANDLASNMNLLAQGQQAIMTLLQQQGQAPKRND